MGGAYTNGSSVSGDISGDFSQNSVNLIGFAPADTNGNPVAVTITSDSGDIYSFVPTLGNASVSNGVASFRFTTSPGHTYRVEYKSDLNETTWAPLSADRVAADTSLTVTNVIGPDPRRFYRARVVN